LQFINLSVIIQTVISWKVDEMFHSSDILLRNFNACYILYQVSSNQMPPMMWSHHQCIYNWIWGSSL